MAEGESAPNAFLVPKWMVATAAGLIVAVASAAVSVTLFYADIATKSELGVLERKVDEIEHKYVSRIMMQNLNDCVKSNMREMLNISELLHSPVKLNVTINKIMMETQDGIERIAQSKVRFERQTDFALVQFNEAFEKVGYITEKIQLVSGHFDKCDLMLR